jgi:polyphosphate kinase
MVPRSKLNTGSRKAAKPPAEPSPPAVTVAPKPSVPSDAGLYLNRELSLLSFFRRVLEEAQAESNPLLERVKFLSIVGSNLAEFFMIRVAGLKHQLAAGVVDLTPDGRTPAEQLSEIHTVALGLMRDARECMRQLLILLDQAGIHIIEYAALNDAQKASVDAYFQAAIFPVLTPLAVDPGRPFPHISNMSLNLAVVVRDSKGTERFARVKVPSTLPRFLPLRESSEQQASSLQRRGADGRESSAGEQQASSLQRRGADGREPSAGEPAPREQTLVWLEQVIAANLPALFPGMEIVEAHPFRVTRDADMVIQELEAADLLETVEDSLRQRRFGSVVRLTVTRAMPEAICALLADNLEIVPDDIYTLDPPLGSSDLMGLYKLDRPDLKDPPFVAAIAPAFAESEGDPFAAIRRQDILLHHPYESFSSVVEFLHVAARDPNVLAIKQTLYRVGRNSPVVEALLEAAHNGKQVAVMLELKARFDEESNIEWARTLEEEGVHVVYGLLGLKTHSKIALVVRMEGDRIRRYVHLATGNYNAISAQIYSDLGLFTADETFGEDATDIFNFLTGYSAKQDYRRFLVAPLTLRSCLESLIRREIEHARQGEKGRLIFKLNSLVDKPMIQLLYEASQAGVQVDLIVRGMCTLRPGLPGLSENIRVISIVGRFLEHSRIFYFQNRGQDEVYLGSADLMNRNLDRRVEILFPVQDPRLVRQLRDQVLSIHLADTVKARLMQPDGAYLRVSPPDGQPPFNSQAWFIAHSGGVG